LAAGSSPARSTHVHTVNGVFAHGHSLELATDCTWSGRESLSESPVGLATLSPATARFFLRAWLTHPQADPSPPRLPLIIKGILPARRPDPHCLGRPRAYPTLRASTSRRSQPCHFAIALSDVLRHPWQTSVPRALSGSERSRFHHRAATPLTNAPANGNYRGLPYALPFHKQPRIHREDWLLMLQQLTESRSIPRRLSGSEPTLANCIARN